jgi:hypothetical protein
MLIAAIVVLFPTLALGLWLSSLYLLREDAPAKGSRVAPVHGAMGAALVVLLFLALRAPHQPHAVPGSGGFGTLSLWLLGATLAAGVYIFVSHMRGRAISPVVIATHASLGIAGAVILSAYWVATAPPTR